TNKRKQIGKTIVKLLFALMLVAFFGAPFAMKIFQEPVSPLARAETAQSNPMSANALTMETVTSEETYTLDDLTANIKNFVNTPEGGVDWLVFGDTKQNPYLYTDDEGQNWEGVRPEFSDELKVLDGTEILIQGYMFPLGQDEEQEMFLLGPFPLSCPFHYHVTPNLIIEVHARTPITFSYDPINVKGVLELVPKDDEYNVFYRVKGAEIIR
ncbi:MAG: DUF3299 domain-containing protein, partial [Bdellovibrionales bacterium]